MHHSHLGADNAVSSQDLVAQTKQIQSRLTELLIQAAELIAQTKRLTSELQQRQEESEQHHRLQPALPQEATADPSLVF